MDSTAPRSHLSYNVRAQGELRLKLGFTVLALMLGTVMVWGTSSPEIGLAEILGLSLVYSGYNVSAWYFARRQSGLSPREIVLITAIFDPIMLSGWLCLIGKPSVLFASFYLFTILGFGFRIGIVPMRICQAVSLIGFSLVAYYSPVWRLELMAALSHGILLLIVPLYASSLIRNLHAARHHAENESKAKSQLLANVSHELRTPLTGIVSSAQLIATETKDPAVNARVSAILDLSANLDREIKQLLDLSKLQADTGASSQAPFDLAAVVRHVNLALEPVASRKGIAFETRFDPAINRSVIGFEHELNSVLMNLAGNAVKFTDAGKVEVSVSLINERAEEYVVHFRVSDTGIGIAPEHLGHIFEPFYQVEAGTSRKYGGTGLGTSIAMEHVKRMGGVLRVESSVGKGSAFWFELRMPKSAEASIPQAIERVEAPVGEVAGMHVLIADDHPVNLRLLQEMLVKDGHHVTAVRSGEDALKSLATTEFDAVFLDFNMADMDGARVFQIYSFGRPHTAPTFFITADTSETTTAKLLATAASGLIHKPITFQKLRAALTADPKDYPITLADADRREPSAELVSKAVSKTPAKASAGPATPGQLKLVPPEYISMDALENLCEINPSRQFLETMLSDAIADIDGLVDQLAKASDIGDIEAIRHCAHSLKGVCLNVGAVRLVAAASRMMSATTQELRLNQDQWLREVRELATHSIKALNGILERNDAIVGRV